MSAGDLLSSHLVFDAVVTSATDQREENIIERKNQAVPEKAALDQGLLQWFTCWQESFLE